MRPPMLPLLSLFSLTALLWSCGPDASEPEVSTFEEVTVKRVEQADKSTFDVQWKPGTLVAQEEDVLDDVEDLQAEGGLYTIKNSSSLLVGLQVGSLVVWPQLGVFRVLSMKQRDNTTAVQTEWVTLTEAVDYADISFEHTMSQGNGDRALGAVWSDAEAPASEPGVARQAMTAKKGGPKLTKDGVEYESPDGNQKAKLAIGKEKVTMDFELKTNVLTTKAEVVVAGLKAEGKLTYDAKSDSQPSMRIEFKHVKVTGSMSAEVKGAKGVIKVKPKASMLFPFMVGPIPAYISVDLVVEVEAGIDEVSAQLKTNTIFEIDGEIILDRGPDGDLNVGGNIKSFKAPAPNFEYEVKFSAGVRVAVDAPKVSFGFGRPGLASASIYGTHSAELVSNIAVNPFNKERCVSVHAGSAILAGGEVSFLGLGAKREKQIGGLDGYDHKEGKLCK